MIHFLMIMETLAVFALLLFNGILDSKYYQKLSLHAFSRYVQLPLWLMVVAGFLTVLPESGITWSWQDAAAIFAHTVLHAVFAVLLTVAVVKFSDIPFKYARQYLFARAALYFAVVFEVLALGAFVVCCVKVF